MGYAVLLRQDKARKENGPDPLLAHGKSIFNQLQRTKRQGLHQITWIQIQPNPKGHQHLTGFPYCFRLQAAAAQNDKNKVINEASLSRQGSMSSQQQQGERTKQSQNKGYNTERKTRVFFFTVSFRTSELCWLHIPHLQVCA